MSQPATTPLPPLWVSLGLVMRTSCDVCGAHGSRLGPCTVCEKGVQRYLVDERVRRPSADRGRAA